MKRLGDSGKGMQFTSAKKGAQQPAPDIRAGTPVGIPANKTRAGYLTHDKSFNPPIKKEPYAPQRERIVDGGNGATTIHSRHGRGANDGSKPSPRKKIW